MQNSYDSHREILRMSDITDKKLLMKVIGKLIKTKDYKLHLKLIKNNEKVHTFKNVK